MSSEPHDNDQSKQAEEEAAAWILRHDRGLTAGEQDEFSDWLAAHPMHRAQLARHRRHWRRLDGLKQWKPEHSDHPNPDLLAPAWRHRFRGWRTVGVTLGAAAAIVLGLLTRERNSAPTNHTVRTVVAEVVTRSAGAQTRILDDGTVVELNGSAVLDVRFTPNERRVALRQGEAHFAVTKDATRPFIVQASGIDVRAVGTAFNVRVDATAVEVLVTEGRVHVASPKQSPDARPNQSAGEPYVPPLATASILEAHQRAVITLDAPEMPPQIATLTPREIERVLAWQHRLLDFTAAPLTEIVAEFNRRNVMQLVVIDPELAATRISATFRSDNIEGFLRLIEAGFGARTERRGDSEILLRKKG